MASAVILLLSGPTAMNASTRWSRAISAIWLVPNWVTVTLSGLMPDFGQDHAQQRDVGLRSSDHADAVAGEFVEALDLGRRLFSWSPSAQCRKAPTARRRSCAGWRRISALAGRFRSPRATARSALPAVNSAMLSAAPVGRDRRQPDRAAVARKGLRHQLDQLLVLASGRADGDPQGDRPQHIVKRAGGDAEQENARGEDQQRIAPSLPSRAGWRGIVRSGLTSFCHVTRKIADTAEKEPYRSMTSYA